MAKLKVLAPVSCLRVRDLPALCHSEKSAVPGRGTESCSPIPPQEALEDVAQSGLSLFGS